MDKNDTIGSQALKTLAELWNVTDARSRWRDDGFDWWPGTFRVSVNVARRVDGYVPETWMLIVRTDFLKDVPINDEKFVQRAAMLSRFFGSTYAWVYPPAEVWAEHGQSDVSPRLWFCNTAYLNADNVYSFSSFTGRMSIMQPINAQIQSKSILEIMHGPSLDESRPAFLGDQGLDPILEVAAQVYVPIGHQQNRWRGTGEFSNIIDRWNATENCYGNGDEGGLALETSFGHDTALIRLRTDEKHPQLGEGLLATLQIPSFNEPRVIANECAYLNMLETLWTDIPQFGCWHPHASRAEQENLEGLAFTSFIPNVLYHPGIADLTAIWMLQRARSLRRQRWSNLPDKPINDILEARLAGLNHPNH
jgi:hypothetical protein